jgi:hypothetical protein
METIEFGKYIIPLIEESTFASYTVKADSGNSDNLVYYPAMLVDYNKTTGYRKIEVINDLIHGDLEI